MKYSEFFKRLSESKYFTKKEKHQIVFDSFNKAMEYYDEVIGVLEPLVETSREMWIEDKISSEEHFKLLRKLSHAKSHKSFFKNTSKRKLLKMALRWHWSFLQEI